MGFVYEKVGEENREIWEKIGFKDWHLRPLGFSKHDTWVIDKEKKIYYTNIGQFIDEPNYADLCYKDRIIRMEIFAYGKRTEEGYEGHCVIEQMYIPKSIWDEKDTIIQIALEVVKIGDIAGREDKFKSEESSLRNEPKCVEVDYNGR